MATVLITVGFLIQNPPAIICPGGVPWWPGRRLCSVRVFYEDKIGVLKRREDREWHGGGVTSQRNKL